MKKDSTLTPCVGRPRCFDPDVALEKAMRVFWEKGYEGASLTDLTGAMGINRPSLYATFGNKEELFFKVMNRYGDGPAAYVMKALELPTAHAVIHQILHATVDLLSDPQNPRGCLIMQSALTCSDEADAVRQEARARRVAGEAKIRLRFERAVLEGDLPRSMNPEDLARYVVMLMHGLSVQGANGATPQQMRRVVEFALKTLPL